MKYSTIVLLLLGQLSQSEAIVLEQRNPVPVAAPPPMVKALAQTTQKVALAVTAEKAKPV